MKKLILFLMFILLSSLVSAFSANDPDLLGLWLMNDADVGLTDSKTNSIPKIGLLFAGIVGDLQKPCLATTYCSGGAGDYSIDFDNQHWADNTSVLAKSFFGVPTNYTMGCWASSGGADDDILLSTRTAGGNGMYLGIAIDDSGIIRYYANILIDTVVGFTIRGTLVIANYNGTMCSSWLNDTQRDSTSCTGMDGQGLYGIQIGATDDTHSSDFNGRLDDCFYMNRSLEQSEITDIYQNGIQTIGVAPVLSNPICTSCSAGTNRTIDSTPTVNITCVDSCQLVRIANDSTLTFDSAGASRNCTVGAGDTWVCTVPTSDELTRDGIAQPVYFWANDDDGNNHTNFNITMNITFIIDTTEPSFSNLSTNATDDLLTGNAFQFNATFTDEFGLTDFVFSWNCTTGIWDNNTNGTLNGAHTIYLANKTTGISSGTCGYRWHINDTSGNWNSTDIFTFTVVLSFSKLNGLGENRTYEYETTANVTTNFAFIDILDGTGRWRNQASPFEYPINLLRMIKTENGTTMYNITSGASVNATIDNQTDLYNASVNLTGFSNPSNISLDYGKTLLFPGTLIENNLYQNNFLVSGVEFESTTLDYTTAGSKIIYVNYSTQGNLLTRTGYLNFTITASDLDKGNEFNYTENFTQDTFINLSSLKNTSSPSPIYDDFESNASFINYDKTSSCVSDGNIKFKSDELGGHFFISGVGLCEVTFNQLFVDNVSRFNFTTKLSVGHICGISCSGTSYSKITITDGTNDIDVWTETQGVGRPSSSGVRFFTIEGIRQEDVWTIFRNGTEVGSKSIASLGHPRYIKISAYFSGDSGTTGHNIWEIYDFETSGIRLKRLNGRFQTNMSNATFVSEYLFNATSDIKRAILSVSEQNNENTTIQHYISNDNGTTFESVTPFNFHTFSSTGNTLKVKFVFNSTDNFSSPYISRYSVAIIPASPSGLTVDIGSDGIIDMRFNGTLNSTTTPIEYSGNDSGINNYINNNCQDSSHCAIPTSFTLESGGTLNISNLNLTENINPVRLNTTIIQTLNSIPFTLTYTDGIVQLDDIRFDFRGSKNITVVTHTGDYSTSLNRTIFVKYSPFVLNLTADFFEVFYTSRNQSNVEPFGQNSTHGIFQITSEAYDGNISVHSRYNSSPHSCLTSQEFRGQNFSVSSLTNISTLNITNLTTSNQPIVSDLTTSLTANIRAYSMINCSEYTFPFIPFQYFCFNSLCSECVFTSDFADNCEGIV